jgi:hypothetical protein
MGSGSRGVGRGRGRSLRVRQQKRRNRLTILARQHRERGPLRHSPTRHLLGIWLLGYFVILRPLPIRIYSCPFVVTSPAEPHVVISP